MEWYRALSLLLLSVIGLMALGVPVAFAFMTTNIVGALIFMGGHNALILMGSLFFYSGLAVRVFDSLDRIFGRLPGRLCYLTVAG